MICYVDMDRLCLEERYDGVELMAERMKNIINEKEQGLEETFIKQLHEIIEERWNKMTILLDILAFALSPKYYSVEILFMLTRIAPYRDVEDKLALSRLLIDLYMWDVVRIELMDIVCSKDFSIDALCDKSKVDAQSFA